MQDPSEGPVEEQAGSVSIYGARLKLLGLATACAAGSALTACLALGLVPAAEVSAGIHSLCAAGFGTAAIAFAWRALRAHSPVLHIGPEGFQDRRLFQGVLPWSEILGVGIIREHRQRYLAIQVRPEYRRTMALRPAQRAALALNPGGPKDRIALSTVGLTADLETVRELVTQAASRAGASLGEG